MSTTIDENIVSMKFNNKDFEKNAAATMSTLEKLKSQLDFTNIKNKLEELDFSKLKETVSKIGDIDTTKFNSAMDTIEYRLSTIGVIGARIAENFADKLYSVLEAAMSKLTAFFRFAESGITSGGYRRASNIQSAKFQLEGLGIAWKDIYGDIDYAVTNTAYSLDAAAKVAAQLSASGLKPGQAYIPTSQKNNKEFTSSIDTLAMTLRAISGTASMTNSDYAEIGKIITNMKSRGRIFTTDINSLSERGLGVKGLLADYLNDIKYKGSTKWTESKVADEISKKGGGSISPDILIEMLYEKFGEFATKANETLDGVTANLRSAFARIGEKFFEPIIKNAGPLVNLIDALRIHINALNNAIGPVVSMIGEDIGGLIQDFASKFYTEEEMKDANGKVVTDPNTGEVMKKKVIRKDTIFYPLFEEKEYKKLVKVVDDYYALPEYVQKQIRANGGIIKDGAAYYEVIEKYSNSGRVLFNVWSSVKNIFGTIGDSILNIARGLGFASEQTSFMDVLVSGTEKLRKATESFRNFMGQSKLVQFLLSIGKAMGGIINISRAFFNSVYNHIIAPIFGKAAKALPKVSLIERLTQFNQRLYLLGEKIKNSEDFFGPFVERFKAGASAFWEWIKSWGGKLAEHLSNFFEPIKNIFSNSDMTFIEKLKAVKDYLTEDFIMPGWEKVKSVFEGIADAIGKVVDWFKKLFGIGGGTEEGTLPTMASGNTKGGTGGAFGLLGSLSYINGGQILSLSETLKTAGANIEEGGESSLSIFEKFRDFFSKADFSPMSLALTAVSVALVAIAGAVIYVLTVLPLRLVQVTKILPEFMRAITDPFSKFSNTMRSITFKNNSEAIKSIGLGLLAIVGAVTALVVITKMLKITPKEILVATGYVIVIFGILTGAVVIMAKVSNSMHHALEVNLKNLTWSQFGNQFTDMAKGMLGLIKGVAAFIAIALALGFILSKPKLAGMMADGFKLLIGILAEVVIFTVVIPGLLSAVPAGMTFKTAGLLSAAATIGTIVLAVITLTGFALLMNKVDTVKLWKGMFKIGLIAGWIAIALFTVAIINRVARSGNGKATFSAGTTLLGIAVVISAITTGILMITISLRLLMMGINENNLEQFKTAAIALGAFALIIGGIVIAVLAISSRKNLNKGTAMPLLSIAAMVASITGAILVISAAVGLLSYALNKGYIDQTTVDVMLLSIAGIIGVMAFAVYQIIRATSKTTDKRLLMTMGIVISMVAGIAVIAIALGVLSKLTTPNELIGPVLAIGVLFGVLATVVYGLVQVADSLSGVTAGVMVGTIVASIVGLVAVVGSLIALMVVIKKVDMPWQMLLGILGGFIVAIGAVSFASIKIIESLKVLDSKEMSMVKILSVAGLFLGIGLAVGLMIASLAFLQNMNVGQIAVGGAVLTLLTYMTAQMASFAVSIVSGSDVNWKEVLLALGLYAGMALSIRILAGAIAMLANYDWASIAASGGFLAIMAAVVGGLTYLLVSMSDGIKNVKGVLVSISAYIGISSSLVIMATALRKLAGLQWDDIKAGLLSVLACVGLLSLVLIVLSKMPSKGITSGALGLLSIAGVLIAIGVSAFLLSAAIDTLVGSVNKLSEAGGGDWNAKLENLRTKIGGVLRAVIGAVKDVTLEFADLIFSLFVGAFNYVGDHWDELGAAVTNCLEGIANALRKYMEPIIDAILDILCSAIAGVTYALNSARGGLLMLNIKHLADTLASKLYFAIKEALKGTKIGEYLFSADEAATALMLGKRNALGVRSGGTGVVDVEKIANGLSYESPDLSEEFKNFYKNTYKPAIDLYEDLQTRKNLGDEGAIKALEAGIPVKDKAGNILYTIPWDDYMNDMDDTLDAYIVHASEVLGMVTDGWVSQEEIDRRFEEAAAEYKRKINEEDYEKAVKKAEEEWPEKLKSLEEQKDTLEKDLTYMQENFEKSTAPAVVQSAQRTAIEYQQSLIDNVNKEIENGPQVDFTPIYSDIGTDGKTSSTIFASGSKEQMAIEKDGIQESMVDAYAPSPESKAKVKEYGAELASSNIEGMRGPNGLDSNSPSKKILGILKEGVGGAFSSFTDTFSPTASEEGSDVATSYIDGALGSFNSGLDGLGETIMSKLPSVDSLKGILTGDFSGLAGTWSTIKSIFSGDFDLTSMLGGSSLMDSLNMSSFDMSSMGYTDSFMSEDAWSSSLGDFNPNDYLDSSSIDLDLIVDTSQLDALNKSMSLGTGYFGLTGIAGGSGGNTTINNYNYVQNNTSSGALNTRELNRSTELALTRNRWQVGKGGFYR